ncbi:hypothetical protein DFH06DRAFT_1131142 [Mycena polygramma]|nr:hypothetical protein DFH06DRAFT_1131142 [Mycena polygramma]
MSAADGYRGGSGETQRGMYNRESCLNRGSKKMAVVISEQMGKLVASSQKKKGKKRKEKPKKITHPRIKPINRMTPRLRMPRLPPAPADGGERVIGGRAQTKDAGHGLASNSAAPGSCVARRELGGDVKSGLCKWWCRVDAQKEDDGAAPATRSSSLLHA